MNTNEKVKSNKHIERAVIQESLKDKLSKLRDQANATLNGIATITKSDIVNLVLEVHPDTLSSSEIEGLKTTHLDQVKLAFWMAKRLKDAKAAGENLSLQDILKMSDSMLTQSAPKKERRPRTKKSIPAEDQISAEESGNEQT